jgi:hypothetical protein
MNCGNVSGDPGADLHNYVCGICRSRQLQRIPSEEDRSNDTIIAIIAGSALGAALSGAVGAIVGRVLGGPLGAYRNRPLQQ